MNSLERARAVLARKIPDAVPRALYDVAIDSYNKTTLEYFQQRCGKHPRDCFRQDLRGVKLMEQPARAPALAGADIFGIGDDLGSQRGLLISPALWRELFKPRLKRIVQAVKQPGAATAFFLHTDGQVGEVIPDFIEIGVQILNPIQRQPEVLDPAEMKRLYGQDLIFFGAISVQHTLPFGTPDQVAAEVKLRMETIGAGGGYRYSDY